MAKSEIALDRRNLDRREGDRRKDDVPVAQDRRTDDRRRTPRRRQIDPTTCEREYTADEIEFMQALDAYKRASGRMFPTCSEILEVVAGLGYRKVTNGTTGDNDPSADAITVPTAVA